MYKKQRQAMVISGESGAGKIEVFHKWQKPAFLKSLESG
jgi:hypothetical protein